MHFCLKLGILPFKVIADLIGLYFIAFKNGADGSMGNTLQFGVSRFYAAGLNVLLQRAVCPQFLCPAQTLRLCACNVGDPDLFLICYGVWFTRPGSIIHCILKPCSYIFVDEISYCVRVDTGCLRYLSVGHSICAIKDIFARCTLQYSAVWDRAIFSRTSRSPSFNMMFPYFLFLPIVLSSIPVDKTTIADIHYLHKNFQYTILDRLKNHILPSRGMFFL